MLEEEFFISFFMLFSLGSFTLIILSSLLSKQFNTDLLFVRFFLHSITSFFFSCILLNIIFVHMDIHMGHVERYSISICMDIWAVSKTVFFDALLMPKEEQANLTVIGTVTVTLKAWLLYKLVFIFEAFLTLF